MTTWVLLYYMCFPQSGCWEYVPLARYERFVDCRNERNLYLRDHIRWMRQAGLGDGNALCIPVEVLDE